MQYFVIDFGISTIFPHNLLKNCVSYEFEKVSYNLKCLQMTISLIVTLDQTLNLN